MIPNSNRYSWIFWLSFSIVLFLNVLVWLYVNQVENRFEEELKQRLLSVSRIMNRLIDETRFNLLLPGEQNSLSYIYFQSLIESVRQENDLQSIILFSPSGEILVAAPELISLQKTSSMAGSATFDAALKGNHAVSDIENYAGQLFMSAYGPILDSDGFVTGLHVIEARATYFDVLSNLKNRLLIFSFLNFLLILLIAAGLFRAIRRTLRFRAEMKEQEHLVQLGEMAATVAHEVRNPLSIIEGTNDIIKKKYGKNDDEVFSYIPKEIDRLLVLIENFLRFARTPKVNLKTFNIGDLLRRIQMGVSAQEKERISFDFDQDHSLHSDESLLEQALLNIIHNALQASKPGGQVKVEALQSRREHSIIISDSGPGIEKDDLTRIFDPFFTRKETGTGLGLSISKRMIEQLNGRIEVWSETGKGTSFRIILPRTNRM